MNEVTDVPGKRDAEEALAAAQEMEMRGATRGLYPRWYAMAVALWAGALCAAMETKPWFFIFIGGLLAHWYYKDKRGAWIKEIQSKRDLWITLALSLIAGLVYVAGYVGFKHYGISWAPVAGGIVLFVLIYLTMELSYRSLRKLTVGGEK